MANNIFAFKNSFPYSADVKPTVNKNRFYFIYWLHRACSLYVYTPISMIESNFWVHFLVAISTIAAKINYFVIDIADMKNKKTKNDNIIKPKHKLIISQLLVKDKINSLKVICFLTCIEESRAAQHYIIRIIDNRVI